MASVRCWGSGLGDPASGRRAARLTQRGERMLDPRYRNPSWVTNQVIDDNAEHPFWSARFRMPSKEAVERVTAALTEAGSAHVMLDATADILFDFPPVPLPRTPTSPIATM